MWNKLTKKNVGKYLHYTRRHWDSATKETMKNVIYISDCDLFPRWLPRALSAVGIAVSDLPKNLCWTKIRTHSLCSHFLWAELEDLKCAVLPQHRVMDGHGSCSRERRNVPFSTISSWKHFQRIWQYIRAASHPHTNTRPGAPSRIYTFKIIWDQLLGQMLQQSVYPITTKEPPEGSSPTHQQCV